MPTFATIQAEADDRSLVRKIQKIVICLAPKTVELPAALTGPDSQPIDLKALGFFTVGLVTPDGVSMGRSVEKEDVTALGYASPVRSDIIRVPRTISFTALEKGKLKMLELEHGADYSAVTQSPTSGEIVLDEPDLPVGQEYRMLILGSDGPALNNWILGLGYGAVKLSGTGDETWGGSDALQKELTFDVFTDEEIGVPVRHYIGGTGAKAASTKLGFTQGV